jgi:hypothetical protein
MSLGKNIKFILFTSVITLFVLAIIHWNIMVSVNSLLQQSNENTKFMILNIEKLLIANEPKEVYRLGKATSYQMSCDFTRGTDSYGRIEFTLKCINSKVDFEIKINMARYALSPNILISPYGLLIVANNHEQTGTELSFGGVINTKDDTWYVNFNAITEILLVRKME